MTSGSVTIKKDSNNLIGISIGGGAPLCPCLYIVQIFDNTAASRDGTLQSGDELTAVNGQSVKGKTKIDVAKMIQAAKVKKIKFGITLRLIEGVGKAFWIACVILNNFFNE